MNNESMLINQLNKAGYNGGLFDTTAEARHIIASIKQANPSFTDQDVANHIRAMIEDNAN